MREFHSQLHRYLNIHRVIWEKIQNIKERKKIKGENLENLKNKINSYQKTITLIEARINQMEYYLKTRESLVKSNNSLENFKKLLNYKYETLANTLKYTKEVWKMTKDYVGQASTMLGDLYKQATQNSLKTLTVITFLGVGATFMRLLSSSAPKFSLLGVSYIIIFIILGYLADYIIGKIYLKKAYEIEDVDIDRKIK